MNASPVIVQPLESVDYEHLSVGRVLTERNPSGLRFAVLLVWNRDRERIQHSHSLWPDPTRNQTLPFTTDILVRSPPGHE